MSVDLTKGVSVVICCHNSSKRLPETLEHLKTQQVPPQISWEVLIVDNASSDDTSEVARRTWTADTPMRIVSEAKIGHSNARERGFCEARYAFISFVDDDNWVHPSWVANVFRVMAEKPEVGACGGTSVGAFEVKPPEWFARFSDYYAIGQSTTVGAYVPMLWSAGMSVRHSAWKALRDSGFRRLTTVSGEDQELAFALRLAGWKLWIDPLLRMQHFMPAHRLDWKYLRTQQRARSADLVSVDPYRVALDDALSCDTIKRAWFYNTIATMAFILRNLVRRPHKVLGHSLQMFEGDDDVFRIESYFGRLAGLLRSVTTYDANVCEVHNAKWRSASHVHHPNPK